MFQLIGKNQALEFLPKKALKGLPKLLAKTMLWGAISSKSFYMKIIERGTFDSATYLESVGDIIPYANASLPYSWILEQHGATPRTSRQTKDFLPNIGYSICSSHPILQTLIQGNMPGRCLNLLWRRKIRKHKTNSFSMFKNLNM